MSFMGFIILLVISVIVSAVLHFIFKVYARPGMSSFISKVILGWIGAWLGPKIFGQWSICTKPGGIYVIPAILGSLSLLIVLIDYVKSTKAASGK